MKQYELIWVTEMRKANANADPHIVAERAKSPGVMAYLSPTCDTIKEYATPYTLFLSFRESGKADSYHTSIEDAKRVAAEEVTAYYRHIAEQLGYATQDTTQPCTSNT